MADSSLPDLQKGHTRLSEENLGHLSVYRGELYWDNQRIVTKAKVPLSAKLWIVICTLLSVLAAAVALIANIASINKDLCISGIGPASHASETPAKPSAPGTPALPGPTH
jgi:hypothetical protein